jgi:hypothetical protein
MNRPDVSSSPEPRVRPSEIQEVPLEWYDGVDLAPKTLDSLVTWDVSAHARREQDRLASTAHRFGDDAHGRD